MGTVSGSMTKFVGFDAFQLLISSNGQREMWKVESDGAANVNGKNRFSMWYWRRSHKTECNVCTANVLIGQREWRTNNYSIGRSISTMKHSSFLLKVLLEIRFKPCTSHASFECLFSFFYTIQRRSGRFSFTLTHSSHTWLFFSCIFCCCSSNEYHQYINTIAMHIYLLIPERTNVLYRGKSRCGYRRRRLGRFY